MKERMSSTRVGWLAVAFGTDEKIWVAMSSPMPENVTGQARRERIVKGRPVTYKLGGEFHIGI